MIDVVRHRGTVAELHGLDPVGGNRSPVTPEVWWCDPTDDAIVLGSRQTDDMIDPAVCAAVGLSVVRRRSGGGAVIIRRGSVHWIEVVLPHGTAPDDIRGSMVWIGERWAEALGSLGDLRLTIHRGAMECSEWSDLVCFAGVGPGEVLLGDAKLVGLSQRRTRHGIRIQGLVYSAPVAHEYRALFVGSLPTGDPQGQAAWPTADAAAIATALAGAIAQAAIE